MFSWLQVHAAQQVCEARVGAQGGKCGSIAKECGTGCGGRFDAATKSYLDNIVVYGNLVSLVAT